MNRSGQAVATLAQFFKVTPEEILVAHDEMALEPGIVKFKRGGGHAGHNGLRDIISRMGNNKNFLRLRIGIGHPGDKNKVTGFVLGKAPANEQQQIDAAIDEALRCTEIWYQDSIANAMNRLHSFKG
jgi:PTH1 family peptidyl-tRNA hydrolase